MIDKLRNRPASPSSLSSHSLSHTTADTNASDPRARLAGTLPVCCTAPPPLRYRHPTLLPLRYRRGAPVSPQSYASQEHLQTNEWRVVNASKAILKCIIGLTPYSIQI